jgi:hypothetical protein
MKMIGTMVVAAAIGAVAPHAGTAQSLAADSAAAPDSTAYAPEPFRSYLFGTFGPRPIIRALALAGFDQWRRRPVAFPETWRGFEDRLGSRYAQVSIARTLRFGFSRIVDQRTIRYRPCACGDSASRTAYALLSPLRVNTPTGVRLSILNPVTELASGILVTSARSGGLHIGEGIRNGVTGLAAESLGSLVREFWPWHWRPPFL